MRKLAFLTLAITLAAGCYSGHAVLAMPESYRDSRTGLIPVYRCAHEGFGYIGAPMARSAQNRCKKDARRMGYVVELKEEEK